MQSIMTLGIQPCTARMTLHLQRLPHALQDRHVQPGGMLASMLSSSTLATAACPSLSTSCETSAKTMADCYAA